MLISESEKTIAPLVVHLQFSEIWAPNWRSSNPMIFVFDALRSLGACIKLFSTISVNFCGIFENVEELEILCAKRATTIAVVT